jgi:hypothetical protein
MLHHSNNLIISVMCIFPDFHSADRPVFRSGKHVFVVASSYEHDRAKSAVVFNALALVRVRIVRWVIAFYIPLPV